MIYRRTNTIKIAAALFILAAAVILLSALIEIPLVIKTYAEVFPMEKWIITGGNGAQVTSNLVDYAKGHTASYNISQFDRGEFITADFTRYLKDRKEISSGDTVISMLSTKIIDQIISAEGKLEVALAELNYKNSGEKAPLISEAEERLKLTKEKILEQNVLLARMKQLFSKELCSQQEYELQKWNVDLLNIEAGIYKAQLENLKTGVKPQEARYLEAQVNSAKTYLNFLKQKQAAFTVLSPITGKIIPSFSSDTLLNVVNLRSVVLHEPVKVTDLSELREGDKVRLSFPAMDKVISGSIAAIDKEVKLMNSQQVVYISLIIDNSDCRFLPGLVVENSIAVKKTTMLNYLLRLILNS